MLQILRRQSIGSTEVNIVRRIRSVVPCLELRQYVRAFAQREIYDSSVDIVQPCPASLEPFLELDFGNSPSIEYLDGRIEPCARISIVGPATYRRAWIRLRAPIDSFIIFFQPLGVRQLFGIKGAHLVNQALSAGDVLGNGVLQVFEGMAECESFEARAGVAEEFLLRLAAGVFIWTAVMNTAHHIIREQGAMRVNVLATHSALSVRQFERRFLEEIGIPPKLFARIVRYQMAMDAKLLSPARSWLKIAHQFGYHDQMHMIRDFQKLSGDSPAETLLQMGDMRPEALAASSVNLGPNI